MNELQRQVDELIEEFGGYWEPFEMLAALVEELGELSEEILKVEGVKGTGNRKRLEEEFGDVMFALACMANHYGIDLVGALKGSIEKYRKRDMARWARNKRGE
ncbi:hypothetical protein A3L12_05515 [Thermococcus sp. P6]|uniref:MazG nucleotide pyrophosphohydrolase domain-containing protein n=1 Tax=Thermococcus sp. P6 TaxID=122420 RepID=UPI000B59C607|nr:MazG nucleotide pyrophosphohydrolase domain-containing protein [Thermococcus sp. P6]ASJ10794.1 hypothetical protein A3L12_05515 [Thermococcus sp. P6]